MTRCWGDNIPEVTTEPTMSDQKVDELKKKLASRGQTLLEDPVLLDSVLKDTSLSPAQRASLVAAAKLGFPQSILAQQNTTVPAATVARFFNRLTHDMAIDDDNARAAVQMWASALGRTTPAMPMSPTQGPAVAPTPKPATAAAPSPQPTTATPQPNVTKLDQAVYVQAFKLLRQGRSQPQAAAELQRTGLDSATAAAIVAKVDAFMNVMRVAYRQAGMKNVGIGMLWCVGGIVVTAITYSMASGGGTFVVAWGAVVIGIIQALRGLFFALRQPTEEDVLRLAGTQ
jgi:hypothetical protein